MLPVKQHKRQVQRPGTSDSCERQGKKMNDILQRIFFCHLSSLHISLFLLYFSSSDHQGSYVSLGSLGLCLVPDTFCYSQIFMMTAWNFWNALVSCGTIVGLSLKRRKKKYIFSFLYHKQDFGLNSAKDRWFCRFKK